MAVKDKLSSICKVAPNVQDKETNLKDHNPTQEKETDLNLKFMVWDRNIRDVTLGCCQVDADTAHAVIRYADASGYTRIIKGQAHIETPDGTRTPCNMAAAAAVLDGINAAQDLSAEVIFDGELDVEKDFDLHLRFPRHGLVVRNVAKGNNPLTVIDLFT